MQLANVLGIPVSTAVKRLHDDGFQAVVRSVFSTKPQGAVAAQKPAPGTKLARGAAVTLSVSKGQLAKPVPDVVGQSESQAIALLKAAGFGTTPVSVPSGETKGNVIAQKPKPGEKAQPGTNVRLNVSRGATASGGTTTAPAATTVTPPKPAQPATVTVPDVEGKTLQEARLALRKAGIVMAIRYVPNEQPSGTVVAQAKSPGATVKRGDHMLVTVSEGGSGGTAAATLVAVPNVVGMDEQAAQARLQQAGFAAIVEDYPTSDSSQDGSVVDEQPARARRRRRARRSSSTSAGCRAPAEARRRDHMGMGIGLILIAVGAILTWGVKDTSDAINLDAVGVILMIVGAIGFTLSMMFWSSFWGPGYFRRTSYAAEGAPAGRRATDAPPRRRSSRKRSSRSGTATT